jgi:predicted MFS family arabinose efflux permease
MLFQQIYEYNDLQIGLCYLPYGFGAFVAIVGQGYILDWNYRRIAKKLGMTVSRRRGDDLSKYPIETARIQPIYPSLILGAASLSGYGWSLHYETSVAAPLVFVFLIGLTVTSSFSVLGILLIDTHPEGTAKATAANNLVRCISGAAGTAVVEYMIRGMGRGWCFTFLGLLILVTLPGLRLLEKSGPRWRAEKAAKSNR